MLFFTGSYQFIYHWTLSIGILKYLPLLINTEICFAFLIGPFLYFYYCAITGAVKFKPLYILPHLIPFIITGIFIVFFNISNNELVLNYVNNSVFPDYSHSKFIMILNSFGDASLAIYFFLALFQISIFFKSKKIDIEIRIVLILLLLLFINTIILIISNVLNNTVIKLISIAFYCIIPIYYAFFSFRYPNFALKVIKEYKSIRYKSSILKKHDTALIEKRLVRLMEEEKMYTIVDLTIQSLSSILMIKPYELSSILNERFGKNFHIFINCYRINESKKLLLEKPYKSIIEIAFSSGFNSTSSFYTFFKKEVKISPTEYRKKMSPNL